MKDQRQYNRLLRKMRPNELTGCWEWTGFVHSKRKYPGNRYGGTTLPAPGTPRGSRTTTAHRAMWIVVHGEPVKGIEVCHTCDNPICINPAHLFLGTHKQNMTDCRQKGRHFLSAKTLCKRGHPLSGENLYVCSKGLRHCKACCNERQRLYWHTKPEKRRRQQELRRLRRAQQVTVGAPLSGD